MKKSEYVILFDGPPRVPANNAMSQMHTPFSFFKLGLGSWHIGVVSFDFLAFVVRLET